MDGSVRKKSIGSTSSDTPPATASANIAKQLTRRKFSISDEDTGLFANAQNASEDVKDRDKTSGSDAELLNAIRDGDLEAAQMILAAWGYGPQTRERLNRMDANGYTPLCVAAKHDESLIAEMLIGAKADVSKFNNAALFMAARWGKNEVLPVLLRARADVEAMPQGVTALGVAARGNQAETVILLIEWASDVNSISSKGRTVLNVAWDSRFLDVVRILVSNGATLTDGMWMEASASPNLCFNLGEGLTERIRKLGRHDIPVITLPALYAWVESAPDACVPLLDIVMLKEVTEFVPSRADLGGRSLQSIYTLATVFDRKDKEFNRLCPPDTGQGCTVRVRTMEVKGILHKRMLYALSTTLSRHIFSSVTVQALLEMSFFNYIFNIFMADIVIEVLMLLLFWLNLVALSQYNDQMYRGSRLALLLVLLLVSLRDTVLEFTIFSYGRSVRKGVISNVRIGKLLVILPNYLYFLQVFPGDMFDLNGTSDLETNQPTYLPIVAIATFLRYVRLLNMSMEFRIIGIKTLPIFHALLQIGAFALLFFLMLFAFIHALYVFYHDEPLYTSIGEFATRQVALGMVTRWPIFMNAFSATDEILGERYVWLLIWYAISSFSIVIILLQMFVGVLRAAYVDEKLFAHATFSRKKANTCFEYFLFRQRGAKLNWFKERVLQWAGTFVEPPAQGVMWICETTEEERGGEGEEEASVGQERQAFESLHKLVGDSSELISAGLERVQALEWKVEQVVQQVYGGLSPEKRADLVGILSQGLERRTREDRQAFQMQKMGNRGKFSTAALFGNCRKRP